MNDELKSIIEGCKKGSREAQRQLYFLTINDLKNIVCRYCRNIADAEDILQSSYLIIFEKISSFDESKGQFNSWSSRILINEYFQLIRKNKKIQQFGLELTEHPLEIDFNWHKFTLEEVRKTIDQMRESHAIILNLYFFEEYSFQEISSLLKIKQSSVRGNLTRAKQAFEIIWNDTHNLNTIIDE